MDESMTYLKEKFGLGEVDIHSYSPLTLAYMGDAAYEIVIRTILVDMGNRQPSKLHRLSSGLVKAATQAAMAEAILPVLTEEEEQVYLRGRNAKSPTMAKHATVGDYRKATGFEALMGYLYLAGEYRRMTDLIYEGLRAVKDDREKKQAAGPEGEKA